MDQKRCSLEVRKLREIINTGLFPVKGHRTRSKFQNRKSSGTAGEYIKAVDKSISRKFEKGAPIATQNDPLVSPGRFLFWLNLSAYLRSLIQSTLLNSSLKDIKKVVGKSGFPQPDELLRILMRYLFSESPILVPSKLKPRLKNVVLYLLQECYPRDRYDITIELEEVAIDPQQPTMYRNLLKLPDSVGYQFENRDQVCNGRFCKCSHSNLGVIEYYRTWRSDRIPSNKCCYCENRLNQSQCGQFYGEDREEVHLPLGSLYCGWCCRVSDSEIRDLDLMNEADERIEREMNNALEEETSDLDESEDRDLDSVNDADERIEQGTNNAEELLNNLDGAEEEPLNNIDESEEETSDGDESEEETSDLDHTEGNLHTLAEIAAAATYSRTRRKMKIVYCYHCGVELKIVREHTLPSRVQYSSTGETSTTRESIIRHCRDKDHYVLWEAATNLIFPIEPFIRAVTLETKMLMQDSENIPPDFQENQVIRVETPSVVLAATGYTLGHCFVAYHKLAAHQSIERFCVGCNLVMESVQYLYSYIRIPGHQNVTKKLNKSRTYLSLPDVEQERKRRHYWTAQALRVVKTIETSLKERFESAEQRGGYLDPSVFTKENMHDIVIGAMENNVADLYLGTLVNLMTDRLWNLYDRDRPSQKVMILTRVANDNLK